MSKELEALERMFTNEFYDVTEEYTIIKKALTPPTADEVCKALSDWLKEENPDLWNHKVYHDDGGFHYNNNEDYEIYLVDYDEISKRIFFPRYLPPHLTAMISRFYESLEDIK